MYVKGMEAVTARLEKFEEKLRKYSAGCTLPRALAATKTAMVRLTTSSAVTKACTLMACSIKSEISAVPWVFVDVASGKLA